MASQLLIQDLLRRDIKPKKKLWSYRKKFLSKTVVDQGINDDNYKEYLPDFRYFKLHPLNTGFGKWIDDKLTMKLILEPFSEFVPQYYFHFFEGKILKLPECPGGYNGTVDDILKILHEKKRLACKKVRGGGGDGFFMIREKGEQTFINKTAVDRNELSERIQSLDNYIVTEYVTAHPLLKKISPDSPNSMRLVVIHPDDGNSFIAAAYLRFGTKHTRLMEVQAQDGIISKIDIINGQFSDSKRRGEDGLFRDCRVHPDTGREITGTVPHWNLIKEKVEEISNYLPQLRFMGFDIAVTEGGFKILEINSLPGLTLQHFFPLLKDERTGNFFKSRIQN